jgi:hypothetical protein
LNTSIKNYLVYISLLLLLNGCSRAPSDQDLHTVLGKASADSVVAHVFELADGKYEGRPTGMPSMIDASEYVGEKMKDYNLKPGVRDTSYFQWWTVDYNQILEPSVLRATIDGRATSFTLLKDFMPWSYSGAGNFSNRSFMIADSGAADSDITASRGSVVLFMPPSVIPVPDEELSEYELRGLPRRYLREIAQRFADAGAAGLLIPGEMYGRISTSGIENLPVFVVTSELVDRLTQARYLGQKQGALRSVPRIRISGEVNTEFHRNRPTVNVAGAIEGSDRRLRDEYIILCAHTDHVGTIAGQIHYGAHDNASGTAVMLEVARLFNEFKSMGFRPRRSVLFIGFSGEEMGLLGSKYYLYEDPIVAWENTGAVLNLDILGGGTGYMAVGGVTYPDYFSLLEELNEARFGFELLKRPNVPNSDHYFFGEEGIPSIFLYALTGPPVGIHTPTDTPEKMDPEFMKQTSQFIFSIVWELANRRDLDHLSERIENR